MTHVIPLVDISVQPIELCKLLKIANMVGGGGEAKIVISEGYVLLNDEVEFQKRKKVYHDDIVEFNGEVIQVNLVKAKSSMQTSSKLKEPLSVKTKKPKKKNIASETTKNSRQPEIEPPTGILRSKRGPISF